MSFFISSHTGAFDPSANDAYTVLLYPEYNYDSGDKLTITEARPKGGDLYSYVWGSYTETQFDAMYVTAADAALLNSWHKNKTQVTWGFVDDLPSVMGSGYLQGDTPPCRNFIKPYADMMVAQISLST